MEKPASKNSRSFLQKFEGKKNAISREGLLHLLDAKRQSSEQLQQHNGKKVIILKEPLPIPPKDTRADKSKSTPKEPSGSRPVIATNELQERYMRMREQLREPKSVEMSQSSKIRLPAINKSSSHSTHLHKKNAGTAPEERPADPRTRSQQQRQEDVGGVVSLGRKMQLDKYALRHLQFLDKFQKQLLQGDSISKKTSRSEYL